MLLVLETLQKKAAAARAAGAGSGAGAAGAGSGSGAATKGEGEGEGEGEGGAKAKAKAKGENEGEGLETISLPASAEDREALVQWAYNEASLLIRQYGDLIESVSDYIQSGTASIGECAMLIEQELR